MIERVRRATGFTLIELLVTIVLAGIVFAAMAPLFIGAQQVAAGDQMRNISLNLARDRIEKIRQVDYDDITLANLQSSTFQGGQFGTTWTSYSGPAAKVFNIAYTVSEVGGGSSQPAAYKQVTVSVEWTAPPKPVKAAVLSTFVNRQYAGPTIVDLDISPIDTQGRMYSSPVTIAATIAADDLAATTKILFFVSDQNGNVILQTEDTTPAAGKYSTTWDCSSAPEGMYTIRAQGYAGDNVGNTWERSARLAIDSPPPAVANLAADAGDQSVTLSWDACTVGDFSHYEIWRGVASGGEALLISDITANGYTDTGLANHTTYYYEVRAVDTAGLAGGFSNEASARPHPTVDDTPPTQPGSFTATANNNTAVLTWTASTDPEEPSTGVQGYYIYRDGGATPYATYSGGGSGTLTWSDLIGWSTTHTYYVVAFDGVGLLSPATLTLSVTTPAPPTFTLKVTTNKTSPNTSVTVIQTDSVPPNYNWGTKTCRKNTPAYWYNMPAGSYTVTAIYNGTTKSQSFTQTSSGTKTIAFTF